MTETRNASPDTLGEGFELTEAMITAGWSVANNGGVNAFGVLPDTAIIRIWNAMMGASMCPDCRGRGYVAGDPEGAPIEGCNQCDGTGNLSDRPVGMSAANEILTPPINDSGEGEPVAWQCRVYGVTGVPGPWEPSDGPNDGKTLRPCRTIEYRALYAAPSPKGPWLSNNAVAIAGATAVKKAQGYGDAELDGWIKRQPDLWSALVNTFLPAVPVLRSLLEQPAALSNPAQALPDGEGGAMSGLLTGDTRGYDPEHREWLAMDLRQIADNSDNRAGYATADAQTLRIAANQFDGLGIEATAEEARSFWRDAYKSDRRVLPDARNGAV